MSHGRRQGDRREVRVRRHLLGEIVMQDGGALAKAVTDLVLGFLCNAPCEANRNTR